MTSNYKDDISRIFCPRDKDPSKTNTQISDSSPTSNGVTLHKEENRPTLSQDKKGIENFSAQ